VPAPSSTPPTVEALLRVVEQRDSEVAFLKLMVDKLTLQLLRARRAQYGRSSEQLDDPQIALIEGAPLYEHPAPKAVPKPDAANSAGVDRCSRHDRSPTDLQRREEAHASKVGWSQGVPLVALVGPWQAAWADGD
jgi:Transposase C of IS166 homeodomain